LTSLLNKVQQLPESPGVYLFKDRAGRPVYIGKANKLRTRALQYIRRQDDRLMVDNLLRIAEDIDVTITANEKDALILENMLIKKFKPRFNIKLVDDAQHLHFRLDLNHSWPRIDLVRQMTPGKGIRYWGPSPRAAKARRTLQLIERSFGLRSCSDSELSRRKKPCLLYQMKRCSGPCIDAISSEAYRDAVKGAQLFLDGKSDAIFIALQEKMMAFASEERFEEAAVQRDLIASTKSALSRQKVVDPNGGDIDVWAMVRRGEQGVVAIIPIRSGRMNEATRVAFTAPLQEVDALLYSGLIRQWYGPLRPPPPLILLPGLPTDMNLIADSFQQLSSRRVRIAIPLRGQKKELLALAGQNAQVGLDKLMAGQNRQALALKSLQNVLKIPSLNRIECFDNSTFQGSHVVSSMVVFVDGVPEKSLYRKFRIPTEGSFDDYDAMRQALRRRYKRALQSEPGDWALPDLLLVDGGKGQLNIALTVLSDLGLFSVPVVGIAKPKVERRSGDNAAVDKLFLPGVQNPIRLPPHHLGLRLLQHLRDEAHRTAVGFHRRKRRKSTLKSNFLNIDGVGPQRRKSLLKHFGSHENIRQATVDELKSVYGISAALSSRIHQSLRKPKSD